MSTQLLIYNEVVPVSFARHADLSIKATGEYGFARHVNSVPLVASEIVPAAAEYPVVFAVTPEGTVPVAVLGLTQGENLFVGEDGKWLGNYVPAFLRRYPFVFSSSEEGRKLTLCVDESYAGCNREDRGERLFDAEGEHTLRLKSVLEFLKQYQAEFDRTKQFCANLQQLGVLEPMNANFRLPGGREGAIGGFSGVDRGRLKAIGPEALDRLARTDELELAYLQINSLRHFQSLVERAGRAQPAADAAATGDAGEAAAVGTRH